MALEGHPETPERPTCPRLDGPERPPEAVRDLGLGQPADIREEDHGALVGIESRDRPVDRATLLLARQSALGTGVDSAHPDRRAG